MIACTFLLASCGGGGGSGGATVAPAATPDRMLSTGYSGVQTAMEVTPENSLTFLARSLETISLIPAFGDVLGQNTAQHDYDFFRTEEDFLLDESDAVNEDQLCDSGSTRVVDELNPNNGLGIVRQVYDNCFLAIDSEQSSNGGASINGELWINVRSRSAGGVVTQHDVELVDIEVVDYRGRRLQLNGTIQAIEGRLSATVDTHFLTESVRIRLENFLYRNTGGTRYEGRVYQSDVGYADLTVEQTINADGNTYTVTLLGGDSTGLISIGQDATDNIGRYITHYDAHYFPDINADATDQTLVPQELLFRRIADDNRQPVASIESITAVERLSPAVLNASNTTDADADFLFYDWSIQSQPVGCAGTINNADRAVAELVADCVGPFEIALNVSDRITTPSTAVGTATTLNYLADYSIDAVSQSLQAGDVFEAQVSFSNPQDGPFNIRLMSGPEGMTVDDSGGILWDSRFLPLLSPAMDVHYTIEVSNERAVQQTSIIDVQSNAAQSPFVQAALRGNLVATANLDDDLSDEALFIAPDHSLFAVEYNGGEIQHLWTYNIALSADPDFNDQAFSPFVTLADVAGDARSEIIIAADDVLHVLDALTRETLFTVDLTPFLPECLIRCSIAYGSMAIADIDLDGQSEVLVISHDELADRSTQLTVQMVSIPGGEVVYTLSNFEGSINTLNSSPAANLDDDSNLEFLGSSQIWDFVAGTVRPLPSALQSHTSPIVAADLDGDGRHEIVQRSPGVDGGSQAQLIRFDPADFSELGRINLPSLTDFEGSVFNNHGVRVLGNIDDTPGDELLVFGSHTQRAIIDSTNQATANTKLEHSTAFALAQGFAYGDFTGNGGPEALLIPENQVTPALQLIDGSGLVFADNSSYAARSYQNLQGGSLLAPDIDSNTLFFTTVDFTDSGAADFDGRIQRLTFDLASEQFSNLGAPNAFAEPADTFVSSLSRLFGDFNRDLNDDGFKDIILHEVRGGFPSAETFWVSAFDGQTMTTLFETEVDGAAATTQTYSTGVPSPVDDSFTIFSTQFVNRLFRNGELLNNAPISGKPILLDSRAGSNVGLHLVFRASDDYSGNGTAFTRGFNFAAVNQQNGILTSTPFNTLLPFYEYDDWFVVQQDVNGDSIDEVIIVLGKSESDFDNRSELIVLDEQMQVVFQQVLNGQVTAIAERAYGSASPNIVLALTNTELPTERDFVTEHLVAISATNGQRVWQSPPFTGKTLAGSLHIIDVPGERQRVVNSTRNYVMITQ
ncbi:MAG: hypothetical protein AAF542_23175 [Pseudomonadota bacterium]